MWPDFVETQFFEEVRSLGSLFINLANRSPGFCICRYEEIISGQMAEVETYLGFSLTGSAEVGAEFQRVVRTRGSGSWRDWFTASDVAAFKPLLRDYMQRFGYAWEEWELAETPHIEPRHAAEYVKKLIAERRQREAR